MQTSISTQNERQAAAVLDASSSFDQPTGAAAHSFDARRDGQWIRALGWFSVGLGVLQLLAPRAVARSSGAELPPSLVRACGARELMSGAGILSGRKTTRWLWSRVVGDLADLALLGASAARASAARRRRLTWLVAAVAGIAVLDSWASVRSRRRQRATRIQGAAGDFYIDKALTIHRTPEECYRFWRDFENFPRFMRHLESVVVLSDTRSHWIAKGPAGVRAEWDAEIVADEPDKLLAWSSVEGSDVDHAGIVRFEVAPGGRGTIVQVELQYSPPGGTAGALAAKLFGADPERQLDDDLRRFKQLLETGEIPTTVGQPSGRRGIVGRLAHRGAQQ
ncbi:MAG TPA: SRPBCC family protein [Paucimonas sp.]|nr:SRPBCC family protein [Paucimonas sp.]